LRSKGFTKFSLSKSTSTILVATLIVISFAAFEILNIDAHHGMLTKTFDSGPAIIPLRDVNNPNPESSTISGEVNGRENMIVTVNDLIGLEFI